ncbi:MAG: glycosyltransferase [Phycisphaerae bacterium]
MQTGCTSTTDPRSRDRVQSESTGRTLVVSWHWPPTKRASTQVLATLFGRAPADRFTVLTRGMRRFDSNDATAIPNLPTHEVRWSGASDDDGTIRTWFASIIAAIRFWRVGKRICREYSIDRVLAVYPHRYSLLVGWLIARSVNKPFVAYMHDLFAETLIARNKPKRAFWQWVDRCVMKFASLVIVPTREFAEHYQRRGVRQTWVLPHCIESPESAMPLPCVDDVLRLTYAGSIYQAHEDSIARLIEGVSSMDGVSLTFLSQPHPMLAGQDVCWLDRSEAMQRLADSHVLVVAAGHETPYPEEVQGCFPSKIVDYLAMGRPILAAVPPGSFVERFVAETGCGISVSSRNPEDIRKALEELRDIKRLAACATAAQSEARKLDAAYWMDELTKRLTALGAPASTSPRSTFESHPQSHPVQFSEHRPTCEV